MAVSEPRHAAAHTIDDLFRRYAGDVYRYAFAVVGQRADAEDVTQTTFLNAYRALERGVRPRKPSNWLLAIASNVLKQRFRTELSKPRHTPLGDAPAGEEADDETPTVGELLAALGRIAPLQRQAIVLREFEGRPYREIAEILGVTPSALETLLFRARRALAEELDSQLTCTEAQLAVSRAADRRLDRKERRRLRTHIAECPDCARFARLQQRNRRGLRNLALVPVPVLEWPFRGVEAPAAAVLSMPTATVGVAAAGGGSAGTAAGVLGGGVAAKAAAVVTAASIAGGAGIAGGAKVEEKEMKSTAARVQAVETPGERVGQVAPRGVAVPGRGVALGRTGAVPRAEQSTPARRRGTKVEPPGAKPDRVQRARPATPPAKPPRGRSAEVKGIAKPPPAKSLGKPPVKSKLTEAKTRGQVRETPAPVTPVWPERGGPKEPTPYAEPPRATSAGAP